MNWTPIKLIQSIKARLRGSSDSDNSYASTLSSFGIQYASMKSGDGSEKRASTGIVPEITSQRAVTLREWQQAVDMARHPQMLNRRSLDLIYENVMLDLHLDSVVDTRVLHATGSVKYMYDANGDIDKGATKMINSSWGKKLIKEAILSQFYGYSLIEFWDMNPPETHELNSGKKTFSTFKDITLIKRAHVRPPLKRWYVNPFDDKASGFPYTEAPYSNYYIGIGDPDDLGKLLKIAPIVLAKRYAMGAWSEFDEKLGIPFRKVTMQGQNQKREKLLAEIMKNMGSAGWGIFHEGETVELIQAQGSDPHKCFLELINLVDSQISKCVLGQTMTTDSGSSLSQSEVHERTGNIRFESDQDLIEAVASESLIPLMIKRGYPFEGYKLAYDKTEQLDAQKQINIDGVLLQYYDLDPEYLSNKYNIPIDAIHPKLNVTTGLAPILPKADPKAGKK